MPQENLMTHDPATGEEQPYPSHALQWRKFHGPQTAWLFNPWTGTLRDARDIGSDPFGTLVSDTAPCNACETPAPVPYSLGASPSRYPTPPAAPRRA